MVASRLRWPAEQRVQVWTNIQIAHAGAPVISGRCWICATADLLPIVAEDHLSQGRKTGAARPCPAGPRLSRAPRAHRAGSRAGQVGAGLRSPSSAATSPMAEARVHPLDPEAIIDADPPSAPLR